MTAFTTLSSTHDALTVRCVSASRHQHLSCWITPVHSPLAWVEYQVPSVMQANSPTYWNHLEWWCGDRSGNRPEASAIWFMRSQHIACCSRPMARVAIVSQVHLVRSQTSLNEVLYWGSAYQHAYELGYGIGVRAGWEWRMHGGGGTFRAWNLGRQLCNRLLPAHHSTLSGYLRGFGTLAGSCCCPLHAPRDRGSNLVRLSLRLS